MNIRETIEYLTLGKLSATAVRNIAIIVIAIGFGGPMGCR